MNNERSPAERRESATDPEISGVPRRFRRMPRPDVSRETTRVYRCWRRFCTEHAVVVAKRGGPTVPRDRDRTSLPAPAVLAPLPLLRLSTPPSFHSALATSFRRGIRPLRPSSSSTLLSSSTMPLAPHPRHVTHAQSLQEPRNSAFPCCLRAFLRTAPRFRTPPTVRLGALRAS